MAKQKSALELYADQIGKKEQSIGPLGKRLPKYEQDRLSSMMRDADYKNVSRGLRKVADEEYRVGKYRDALEAFNETGDKKKLQSALDLMTTGERFSEMTKLKYFGDVPKEYGDYRITDTAIPSMIAPSKAKPIVHSGQQIWEDVKDGKVLFSELKQSEQQALLAFHSDVPAIPIQEDVVGQQLLQEADALEFEKKSVEEIVKQELKDKAAEYAKQTSIPWSGDVDPTQPHHRGTPELGAFAQQQELGIRSLEQNSRMAYPKELAIDYSARQLSSAQAGDALGRWISGGITEPDLLKLKMASGSDDAFALSRVGDLNAPGKAHGFSLHDNPFAYVDGHENIAMLEKNGKFIPTYYYGGIPREFEITMFPEDLKEIAKFGDRSWLTAGGTGETNIQSKSLKQLMIERFGEPQVNPTYFDQFGNKKNIPFQYDTHEWDAIINKVWGSDAHRDMQMANMELAYNGRKFNERLITPEMVYAEKRGGEYKVVQTPNSFMFDYDLPEVFNPSDILGHPQEEIVFNSHKEYGTFLEKMIASANEPFGLTHTGAGYRVHPLTSRIEDIGNPKDVFDFMQANKSSLLYNAISTEPGRADMLDSWSPMIRKMFMGSARMSERISPKVGRRYDIGGQDLGIFGPTEKIDDRNLVNLFASTNEKNSLLARENFEADLIDGAFTYEINGARKMASSFGQFSENLRNGLIKSPAPKSVIGLLLGEKLREEFTNE